MEGTRYLLASVAASLFISGCGASDPLGLQEKVVLRKGADANQEVYVWMRTGDRKCWAVPDIFVRVVPAEFNLDCSPQGRVEITLYSGNSLRHDKWLYGTIKPRFVARERAGRTGWEAVIPDVTGGKGLRIMLPDPDMKCYAPIPTGRNVLAVRYCPENPESVFIPIGELPFEILNVMTLCIPSHE